MRINRLLPLAMLAGSTFTSCVLVAPSCHKQFTAFRSPVQDSGAVLVLRSDGVYVNEELNEILVFNRNGLVKAYPNFIPHESDFWRDPGKVMQRITSFEKLRFDQHERWGAYSLKSDALLVQRFNYHTNEFCKRSVFEYTGTILSDTAFIITSKVAYWFDKAPAEGHWVYRFYPTSFTPDDRRIWFENRRWYKRGRHPSRAR